MPNKFLYEKISIKKLSVNKKKDSEMWRLFELF